MSTSHSFSTVVFIRKNKSNKNLADIYLRITVDGQRSEISLKEQILANSWDTKKEIVKGKTIEVKAVNEHIANVRTAVRQKYRDLLDKGRLITALSLRDEYTGVHSQLKGRKLKELLSYYETIWQHKLRQGGFKNYRTTIKYLNAFLASKFSDGDVFLSQINTQFATDFEHYIRTTPIKQNDSCQGNGLGKHLQRFKRIMNWAAHDLRWIPVNQCEKYVCPLKKSKRNKLPLKELLVLEDQRFIDPMLQYIADLFILGCYTGLAFADAMALSSSHFEQDSTGGLWCKLYRVKSDELCRIPVIKKAKEIIDRYKQAPLVSPVGQIFPTVTNQHANRCLKIIQEICGIQTTLTFHVARHTFAKTVALKNGVPLETVQMMMGHTKITTTQIYADVDEEKIFDDMAKMQDTLSLKRRLLK
ncbi:MAG: site-specific integrase [Sphingobacteriales bacterium]|nr:MAG: site-specific integrase [Sphingobacteriales bacterium]